MNRVKVEKITTSDRLTTVLSYGSLLLLGYFVFLIFQPFLVPLAWSAVLAIFFFPLHERIARRFSKNNAALLSTLGVTLLLIVPSILILVYATKQGFEASTQLQAMVTQPDRGFVAGASDWVQNHLPESVQGTDLSASIRQWAERVASFLASKLGGLVKNLFAFFVDLFILIFAMFFMFRDRREILHFVKHLMPFDEDIQEEMLAESHQLIFASVAVGLLIAAIQGSLGGFAFALAGITSPLFWAVVIGFFSLVPVVGSALIWVPAAIWVSITGHWGRGIMIVAICGGVAGLADNIVRPLLLRNRTRLNELLLFIGVLGGIEVFGLLGLVAGPTLVAAALAVFSVYMKRRDELEKSSAA